jgi:hypothetical protein
VSHSPHAVPRVSLERMQFRPQFADIFCLICGACGVWKDETK